MADRQIKVVGKHVKDCAGVRLTRKGDWRSPWGPIAYGDHGSPVIKTWRQYGKNGRALRTWVRFICNDTHCKAELHVEADFILTAAEKGIRRADSRGDTK
jgi:hypothetical protein